MAISEVLLVIFVKYKMDYYKNTVRPLTEIFSSSKGRPLNSLYLDEQDDVVVCNNMIGQKLTPGYIVPRPMDETTLALFPMPTRTAHYDKTAQTKLDSWKKRTLKELDYCCSNIISYTWQWDIMVNRCIGSGIVTPAIYNFIYLVMKTMARSPPIPAGTKLYRGSKTPFADYHESMGLLSFTTDIKTAASFAGNGGYIASYTVPEGDYIHAVWFSLDDGTSIFAENEALLGPGVCIIKHDNFEQKTITIKIKGVDKQINYTSSEVKIKQLDIGTYFADKLRPEGDMMFRSIIEASIDKVICFNSGSFNFGQGVVIIPDKIAQGFNIPERGTIYYSSKHIPKTVLSVLYVATQRNWYNVIDIIPGNGKLTSFNNGKNNYQMDVYKLKIDDRYIGYYTILGIFQLGSSIGYKKSIETIPFDDFSDIDEPIINHADYFMNRIECTLGNLI